MPSEARTSSTTQARNRSPGHAVSLERPDSAVRSIRVPVGTTTPES